jgi:hypothetical protein
LHGQTPDAFDCAAAVAEARGQGGSSQLHLVYTTLRPILSTAQLPWRKLKDKEEIGLLKIHFNSPELVRTCLTPA